MTKHKHSCPNWREAPSVICKARGYCVCACGATRPYHDKVDEPFVWTMPKPKGPRRFHLTVDLWVNAPTPGDAWEIASLATDVLDITGIEYSLDGPEFGEIINEDQDEVPVRADDEACDECDGTVTNHREGCRYRVINSSGGEPI